ncbi:MAG: hypothetical protein ABEN55_00805 [Bradymonadaceae bacterium]
MEGGLVLVGGLFLVAILGYSFYRRQKAAQAWENFANIHDLSYHPGGWFGQFGMAGDYREESVRVRTEKRRSGKNSKTYTVYSVELPPTAPMDLVMYDERLFSKLGKLVGGQDIEVGRPEFDDAFIIKGGNPDQIREFLDRDTVADALLEVHVAATDLHLEHGTLTVEHRAMAKSGEELEYHLEPIVRCAKVLRSAGKANAIGTMDTYDGGKTEEAEKGEQQGEEYVAEW